MRTHLKNAWFFFILIASLAVIPKIANSTVTNTVVSTTTAFGTGSTVNYTIGFDFRSNTEVTVNLYDTSTNPVTITLLSQGAGGSQYTVTGGNPGTTVTMNTAPTTTQYLIITRTIPLVQPVVFSPSGIFPYTGISNQLDLMTLEMQNLNAQIGGSPGPGPSGSPFTEPSGVPYNIWGWDATGAIATPYPGPSPSLNVDDVLAFNGSGWSALNMTPANIAGYINNAQVPIYPASGGSGSSNTGNMSWNHAVNWTTSGTSNLTLPTSGTVVTGTTSTSAVAGDIVIRDGSGNFSTSTMTGNVSGNVTGNLTGNVTGNVSGTASSITGVNPIGTGGTGQTTQQAAINALLGGTVTAGWYPRGSGTNVGMAAIVNTDLPANIARSKLASSTANSILMDDSSGNMTVLPGNSTYNVPMTNGTTFTSVPLNGSIIGASYWGVDTGTVNNFVIAPTVPLTAYTTGTVINFFPANQNTSNCTVNVSGLGQVALTAPGSGPLIAGQVLQGQVLSAVFDGTEFQVVGGNGSGGGVPGGTNKEIQFNDAGVFAGSANFEWDYTNNGLYVNGATTLTGATSITGALFVGGGSTIAGGLSVTGGFLSDTTLSSGSTLTGGTSMSGGLMVAGGSTIVGGSSLTGGITLDHASAGASTVSGTTLSGAGNINTAGTIVGAALTISGGTTLTGASSMTGLTTLNGLVNGGATTLTGATSITGLLTTNGQVNGGATTLTGATSITGALFGGSGGTLGGTLLTINPTNTTIAGTATSITGILKASGGSTLTGGNSMSGGLLIAGGETQSGATSITGALYVGGGGTLAGTLLTDNVTNTKIAGTATSITGVLATSGGNTLTGGNSMSGGLLLAGGMTNSGATSLTGALYSGTGSTMAGSNQIGGSTLSGGTVSGVSLQQTESVAHQGQQNFLLNAGFDDSTFNTSWSSSSMTGIVDTSNFHGGTQSFEATVSSQTGCVFQDQTPPSSHTGENWEYGAWVKTSATDVQVCARNAAASVGTCTIVPPTNTWQYVPVNYPAPASGSVGVSVCNTVSNTETYRVDDAYVGPARNLSQVRQGYVVGTSAWAMSTNQWTIASPTTTYQNFPANASISAPTITGGLTAPATKLAEVIIPSAAPGCYTITATGTFFESLTGGVAVFFTISDGTNNVGDNGGFSSASNSLAQVTGTLCYTSPQTNLTFQIQGRSTSATANNINIGTGSADTLTMTVRFDPSQSTTVASLNSTSVSAIYGITTGASTAGGVQINYDTKITDIGCPGNCVTTGAGSWKFTAPFAGTYLISNVLGIVSSSTDLNLYKNGVKQQYLQDAVSSSNLYSGSTSIFLNQNDFIDIRPNSTVTTDSGTAPTFTSHISITSQSSYATSPILVGSVTSSGAAQYHVEYAHLGTNCAVSSQSGSWISLTSGSAPSTGCTYAFTAGEFSAPPACTTIGLDDGVCIAHGSSTPTSTTLQIWTFLCSNTSASSTQVDIMCMGPH